MKVKQIPHTDFYRLNWTQLWGLDSPRHVCSLKIQILETLLSRSSLDNGTMGNYLQGLILETEQEFHVGFHGFWILCEALRQPQLGIALSLELKQQEVPLTNTLILQGLSTSRLGNNPVSSVFPGSQQNPTQEISSVSLLSIILSPPIQWPASFICEGRGSLRLEFVYKPWRTWQPSSDLLTQFQCRIFDVSEQKAATKAATLWSEGQHLFSDL